MDITVNNLIASGYREYPAPQTSACDRAFQKVIRDATETPLYFINVEYYEASHTKYVTYVFSVRFYRPDLDNGGFNVELPFTAGMTIETVDKFFADAYIALGCCPDLQS